eukprot:4116911-Prymnesium_polylepis.1
MVRVSPRAAWGGGKKCHRLRSQMPLRPRFIRAIKPVVAQVVVKPGAHRPARAEVVGDAAVRELREVPNRVPRLQGARHKIPHTANRLVVAVGGL